MATEHLDVLIMGAGLSGIGAAWHLQDKCPTKSYAILEARDAIGGTWDIHRYPGVRSDSDMFTLGYNFKPWTGTKIIADGHSIREYIQETARENGIDQKIRFGTKVVKADWSDDTAIWTVTTEQTVNGKKKKVVYGGRPMNDEQFNAQRKANQDRIDAILDKISKKGYDGLTAEEKDFLFNQSNKR